MREKLAFTTSILDAGKLTMRKTTPRLRSDNGLDLDNTRLIVVDYSRIELTTLLRQNKQ